MMYGSHYLEAKMPVVQLSWQFRHPYPGNPDGYYYWTQKLYANPADPTDFPSYVGALEEPYFTWHLFKTQINRLRITMPPGSNTVLENAFAFNHNGNNTRDLPTILQNVARANLWVGTQYVGYKLLRGMIGTEEITNGEIGFGIWFALQTYWGPALIDAGLTTSDGTPIDRIEVDRQIHHWQLRHGTKRRQRVVIAPP
jgi:hypothetical protein